MSSSKAKGLKFVDKIKIIKYLKLHLKKIYKNHVSWNVRRRESNSKLHTVHTAYDPAAHDQCRTPHTVIHGLVLLMMGIMMPETC